VETRIADALQNRLLKAPRIEWREQVAHNMGMLLAARKDSEPLPTFQLLSLLLRHFEQEIRYHTVVQVEKLVGEEGGKYLMWS
jgi:hypothetical protein